MLQMAFFISAMESQLIKTSNWQIWRLSKEGRGLSPLSSQSRVAYVNPQIIECYREGEVKSFPGAAADKNLKDATTISHTICSNQ
jgi:hypothetical protein